MNAALCSVLAAALLAASVNAHGQMTSPTPRPVTATFRTNSGALKNAGDDELQWAPLENLSQRTQADMPAAASFNIMNGCRGFVYEAGGPVTAVKAGDKVPVKWYIQAPHPGYGEFNIVKAKTTGGKIMYEKVVTLKRLEDFAKSGGNFDDSVTIPSTVTGCEKAGDCALQMYWHSDIANQTYPTCADITIGGSGAASSSTPAASAGSDGSSAGEADATPAPASAADDEYATTPATTSAPAATTSAPASTPASTPAPTKKKCNRRFRSRA
ncbi:Chitin-binding protein [Globisporangium polare]